MQEFEQQQAFHWSHTQCANVVVSLSGIWTMLASAGYGRASQLELSGSNKMIAEPVSCSAIALTSS